MYLVGRVIVEGPSPLPVDERFPRGKILVVTTILLNIIIPPPPSPQTLLLVPTVLVGGSFSKKQGIKVGRRGGHFQLRIRPGFSLVWMTLTILQGSWPFRNEGHVSLVPLRGWGGIERFWPRGKTTTEQTTLLLPPSATVTSQPLMLDGWEASLKLAIKHGHCSRSD